MDMHLWEFNNYIIGYRKKIRREQENIVTLAHTTASFHNAKRLKPLQKYLEKIAKNFEKKTVNRNKVDVEKSKHVEEMIAKLKSKKEGEQK